MSTQEKMTALVKAFRLFTALPGYNKSSTRARQLAFEFKSIEQKLKQNQFKGQTVFLVSELNRVLMSLQEILFVGNELDYLDMFLSILSQSFPEEYSHIKNNFDVYEFIHEQGNNILLQGAVQSGKTMVIILVSLCYLACNRNVLIVFRKSLDDRTQFKKRFEEVVQVLREKGIVHRNFVFKTSLSKHVKGTTQMMGLIFSSDDQMDRVRKRYGKTELDKSILFVDEADLRNESTNVCFVQLQQSVARTVFVSATVQDIMVSKLWKIQSASIISLSPSQKYRGIESLEMDCTRNLKDKDEFMYTLCDICIDTEYKQVRPEHPRIVLITLNKSLSGIKTMYNGFKCGGDIILPNEAKEKAVIAYTGSGVQLYHTTVLDTVFPQREMHFKKSKSLKDVLLLMARNGGVERFPNIFIIAFDMASRGINFACYDEEDYRNNWHVTHQILDNRLTCSAVVQSLRILGNHNDDIPLKLYTTQECVGKIRKSTLLTQKLVERIKRDFPDEFTNNAIKQVPIRKTEKPAKFLTQKNERRALLIVPDNTLFPDEVKEEGILNNTLNTQELDYSRQLFEQRARKPNQMITRFLRSIDPERVYSREELNEICKRHNMSLANISKWTSNQVNRIYNNNASGENGNNYGKIIRDNKDGTFQLYPGLRHVYSRCFS
jgi:hypothetical protein